MNHPAFGFVDDGFIGTLASRLPVMSPVPSPRSLRRFLELAFFASMEREEGRPLSFALALVDDTMLRVPANTARDWRTVILHESYPATVASIAKIAPASDYRHTMIALSERGDGLHIVGIVRSNTSRYRLMRGQVYTTTYNAYWPLIARVADIGTVAIDVGLDRLLTIARGVALPPSTSALTRGPVSELLETYAERARFQPHHYLQVVRGILQELVRRGHGGTVLILDADSPPLDFRRLAHQPSEALRDVLRFMGGEGPGYVAGRDGPLPEPAARERTRERTIEEYEFWRDGCSFAADLASIDGALVLAPDLTILGFGAHITCAQPLDVPVDRCQDVVGGAPSPGTLSGLGTRHSSAARFSWNCPGALAFVVSQDGTASCFQRGTDDAMVKIWRPLALDNERDGNFMPPQFRAPVPERAV